MTTRRLAAQIIASAVAAAVFGVMVAGPARAEDKVVKVGINLSLTGADAAEAAKIRDGAVLAFEDANDAGAIPGYKIEVVTYDDGTATAGQYDPAQAATNARKMVSDKGIVAAIGPQMSGAGKAMAPILSQGDLAIITPSSTNPDLTDPKFAAQFRPAGKAIYFRTVTTDAFQGPNLANYFAETLKIKSIYVLDDSGAYGVGISDAFQREIEKKGVKVMGRDKLDPKASDYTAVLTKIKQLNPDAIYYGGVSQAGVKVVKQAYDILPATMIRGAGDGLYDADVLKGAGFPAISGWYVTIASPHLTEDTKAVEFMNHYKAKFNTGPDDYAITAYDGGLIIIDAIKKLAAAGKKVDRSTVRDAIQASKVPTIQGTVSFDANGDLTDRTISIFKVTKDTAKPLDDMDSQYKYIGVAPQS